MRISDWSSDVCSSDLALDVVDAADPQRRRGLRVLDLLADHLQPEPVRALDRRAHLVADRAFTELARIARGQAHEAQRHLREQGVGFRAGAVLAQAQLHAGRHHRAAELLQCHRVHQRLVLAHVDDRSEEHTSELQSLMRISYAVFCLPTKIKSHIHITTALIYRKKTTYNYDYC